MTRYFFAALFFIAGLSCTNQTVEPRTDGFTPELKTREDSLFHEVMEGHDAGMARMGKISKYLTRIQHTLDSINKLPDARSRAKYKQALIGLQEDLNEAEFKMNIWMEGFKVDSAKENPENRIAYLEGEKVKIQKVKEAIIVSLRMADSLFRK